MGLHLSDLERRKELYRRSLVPSIGKNLPVESIDRMINAQLLIEKRVEAALVEDGFSPLNIISKRNEIRGIMFSPQGETLSLHTYQYYVTRLEETGTRSTIPYKRIIREVTRANLFL